MTEEDRRALWAQFAEVHAESQKDYDNSLRTLAAGGIALTASLGTALHGFGASGSTAIVVFLWSLATTVASHWTTQEDMRARIDCLRERGIDGIESNRWTRVTTLLNATAGIALLVGGIMVAVLVASHS